MAKVIAEVEVGEERLWKRLVPLNKEQKLICKKMMQQLKRHSDEYEISQGVLATRRDIESLYRHGTSKKLLQGWRNDVVGKSLALFLEN